MTIKQYGGVFGRNPTFNDVTIEGQLTFDGDIDINSDLKVSGDIETTGNVIIATSGKGIDFSATAGTGTSELLDDYEEGTFTATITTTGGSVTLQTTFDTVAYTKIGRLVTVTGLIKINSLSSPTGSVAISVLPFPIANLGEGSGAVGGGIIFQDSPTYATSVVGFTAEEAATAITTTQNATVLGANDQYRISISYFTS